MTQQKHYFYVYNLVAADGGEHGFFATYQKAKSAQASWNKSRRRDGDPHMFLIGKRLVFR